MESRVELLREKAGWMGKLLEKTREMADCIERQDVDGLSRCTEERQACIDAINALDARMGDAVASAGDPQEAAELIGGLRDCILEIRRIDEDNLRKAQALSETLIAGLRETADEKRLQAYNRAGPADSMYVNRKG